MSPKDNLIQSLETSGWHITSDSVDEFLKENSKISPQALIKQLLDGDLKTIGSKHLPDAVINGKSEKFEANCVLQLLKLRNIGAPKENEHSHSAPPMYKLTLTDGSANINCIAMENIPNLNLNTPPGTKIHLTGEIKIKSNLIQLCAKNVKILGGHVDYLVEKWKLTKDLSNYVRKLCMTDTPPPPWVPFGTKQQTQVDTSKKVFEEKEKKEDDLNEFSEARKAIVAEALQAKSKTTKTFVQQTIDKSKIISESKPEITVEQPDKKKETKRNKKGKFRDIDNEEDYSDKNNTARPPATATLFDAFKTKLNLDDEEKPQPLVEIREARGRGQRNQRGKRFPQTVNRQLENKQVYDPNDFNIGLGDDPKNSSKIKDDFYYNPADFEDKPVPESKTEFKNTFDEGRIAQQQYRNNTNSNKNFNNNKMNHQPGQYEHSIPSMTFNRSQKYQNNNNRNNYQNFNYQQSNYRYDNRDDYGYYYEDEYTNNQYDQGPRYQRTNNNYIANRGNFNRNQNFNRRNH